MDVFQRSRSGYEHVPQGEQDSFVNGEKGSHDERGAGGRRKEKGSKYRSPTRAIALGSLFALVLLLTGFSQSRVDPLLDTTPEHIEPDAQYLHVLIQATQKDHNVCKSVISVSALNYPTPSLLNRNPNFNDTSRMEGGAQVARVSSVLSYITHINNKMSKRHKDVVIVVDGFDTWFQLRPDVMMERFFEINHLANNRLVKHFGQGTMDAGQIRQRVVFGAQKKCSKEPDDMECYAVPESTLGREAYGYNAGRHEKYLDSGFVMGELGAIQKVFEKAYDIMEADKEKTSAQDAFARIFGEQEYQREVVRQRYEQPSMFQLFLRFLHLGGSRGILAPHRTRKQMDPLPVGEAEFGIGLDYESLLASSASGSPELDWIIRNNTENISQATKKAAIPRSNQYYNLPNDIRRSLEPYWARNPSKTLPQNLSWEDAPLLTNLWTGAIPATIQHLSPRGDFHPDSPRQAGWKKMWFQPYARTMLDEHVNEPYRAFTILQNADSETAWWPLPGAKWKIRDHTNMAVQEWLPWKEVCDGFEEEGFGDKLGSWKPPRLEY